MKKVLSRKRIWDATPALVKSAVGRLLEPIPPARLLGRRYRKNSRFVRDTQWWSAERAQEYQLNNLQEMLNLAYEKTDYFRRTFDSAGVHPKDLHSLDDISQFPTTDRNTVIENISDMCTRSISSGDVERGSTAGTSGAPMRFYVDVDRSATEYGYLVASWKRIGYNLKTPMAVLRGRVVQSSKNGIRHEYDPILRHHYYSSFHMSDENMACYLEHISTIGPCYLHVYPSTVAALARFILRSEVDVPQNIEGILAESEIVYPEQRKLVEEVFGCRYFSCYGQSEKVVLAAGCEHSNDYHVWSTYGYFELLDDEGNPVTTPGQRGEIVGTGFINTVMPFVRYRMGDWATYVGDRCEACGREHTLIRDIRGHRTQEVLIAADGSEVPWVALNMHDDTFNHVRQFQFFQEEPGRAVLRVVPANGFVKTNVDKIQRNLGRKLEGQLSFAVELVDAIPLSPRGKAIYVDQRIQQEGDIVNSEDDQELRQNLYYKRGFSDQSDMKKSAWFKKA